MTTITTFLPTLTLQAQLGEETIDLYFVSQKIFSTSAWKRGSLRTLS
jgi:hypothetical protein